MGKNRFTPVYKFTYFELFYAHVTSLIFFKTIIPDQMKQPALSMNMWSFGGFKMKDMVYPCLYGCQWCSCVPSCLKPPAPAGRVTACLCSKLAASFGYELLF
jgi:hypothetical protein